MHFNNRRSLTGGSNETKGEAIIGVVKDVRKGLSGADQRVRIKADDGKKGMSLVNAQETEILVPRKYARDLKAEHRYEFHLEDQLFRGGGSDSSRLNGVTMTRRTFDRPVEVRDSGLNGGSASGNGFRRF